MVWFFGVWIKVWTLCKICMWNLAYVHDVLQLPSASTSSKWGKKILRGFIMISCWAVWYERNNQVFNEITPKVMEVVARLKVLFCPERVG